MNVLQEKQENASANIANVNTPGYKFQDIITSTLESHGLINYQEGRQINQRQELGNFTFGNQIDEVYRVFQDGNLYETEKEIDFALRARDFFAIQMNNVQIAYTRNGNFRLNEANQLVTLEGLNVLARDINGNIGFIYGDENTIDKTQFLITDFNDYGALNNIGDNLFTSNNQGFYLENPEIIQHFLEMSNVHIADQLVKLMEIAREFESHQKLIHTADETLGKAVNEIGRL